MQYLPFLLLSYFPDGLLSPVFFLLCLVKVFRGITLPAANGFLFSSLLRTNEMIFALLRHHFILLKATERRLKEIHSEMGLVAAESNHMPRVVVKTKVFATKHRVVHNHLISDFLCSCEADSWIREDTKRSYQELH